jgi:hypothetical protein
MRCWLQRHSNMENEGKYIYCITETRQDRNFGPIGIGDRGDEVMTIGYDDLSMVASNYPVARLALNRENMLAHQKAIEQVMKEFDSVLPVRFGTVASSADEVRTLLHRRHREFKGALRDMRHKIELGVKGIWEDMKVVFDEIVRENRTIRKLKETLDERDGRDTQAKIHVGQLVKGELERKKNVQAEEIVDRLGRTSRQYRLNKTVGDEMFMNAAFLIDRGREKEFDNIMDDLGDEYQGRLKFAYSGPLPVFNFVNIVIYPEEWEK